MMYMIKRGEQEFGPYSGNDIQQYLASGNIVETDLVRAENSDRWLAVKDILGKKPSQPEPSSPSPSPQPSYSPAPDPSPSSPAPMSDPMFSSSPAPQPQGFDSMGASGFGAVPAAAPSWEPSPVSQQQFGDATGGGAGTLKNGAPLPPDLNWVIVLVATILTCGLFGLVWLFLQANWVKKLDAQSKGLKFLIFYLVGYVFVLLFTFGGAFASAAMPDSAVGPLISMIGSLLSLGLLVLYVLAVFNMKASIEGYFNAVEPINLKLNPILVFFFAIFYFQYHFNRINTWKKTGTLA